MRVTHTERHIVEALIRNHPARLTEAFPPRCINNLYFDTPLQTFYRSHVSGVPERKKIRIRWYGDAEHGLDSPQLEFKSKKGWIVEKRCWPLQGTELRGLLDPQRVSCLADRSGCPPLACEWLRGLEPALMNRYSRRYFRSGDGKVRVTMDDDLSYVRPLGKFGCSMEGYAEDAVIVEIKFHARHAALGRAVSEAFPLSLDKNSKYVTGMELLSGRGTTANGHFCSVVRPATYPRILRRASQQGSDVTELRKNELVHR